MNFMQLAIDKAREAMSIGQPPYAACIVRDDQVIACVHNRIWDGPDATAHAEVEAIRSACRGLGKVALADCTIYSTCEPCCLCTGAIHWAEINTIVYAVSMADEQQYGLSNPTIPCASMVEQLGRPVEIVPGVGRAAMQAVFEDWLKIQSLTI
jgi:guanine deaminase